ncbi:50S ribosomal protein L10 [Streptomonospora sediminis]
MARPDKAAAVAELKEEFESSQGAVLTEYRGLSVAQVTQLRRNLGQNARFRIVKNTLSKIAASEAGLDDQVLDLFEGPSAIAFVRGDVVEAAKGLRDFSKANAPLVIKGGVIGGRAMTPEQITQMADLESREVLLAKLAGALKSKQGQAAALFQALPLKAVRLAQALHDKRAQEGAEA